jgi:DNA-binding transcriptional MerR regulator
MKQLNLVNTKGIAAELSKSVPTIQRWARMRVIPSIRVGWRTRLYDLEAVRRALLKRTVHEVEIKFR